METSVQVEPSSVEEAVRGIFANVLQLDPASLDGGTRLVDDLAVDSLDALELALKIQEVLGIQLEDEEFARFNTYGEVVACARETLGRSTGATLR